jgi:2-keto-4-pentenoate hydratase
MDILNGPEVAAVAAEIGLFEWPTGTLAATVGETSVGIFGPGTVAAALSAIQIHPATTYAPSDSNYWFVQVWKRTAGGSAVLLASGSSANTLNNPVTFTAWVATNLVLVSGAYLSPGDVITAAATKTGTPANLQAYVSGFVKIN